MGKKQNYLLVLLFRCYSYQSCWNVIFHMHTVLACLGLGPNYLTRTDHHRDQYHQGYKTKIAPKNVMMEYRAWFRRLLLSTKFLTYLTNIFYFKKGKNVPFMPKQIFLTVLTDCRIYSMYLIGIDTNQTKRSKDLSKHRKFQEKISCSYFREAYCEAFF